MKAPKHHVEGKSVMVGRVEVARFTDNYQAERFVKFIEEKGDIPGRDRDDGDAYRHTGPYQAYQKGDIL